MPWLERLLAGRSREVWQWPTLASIRADIRFAFRQLWKSPGSAITIILTLSLGDAGTVAIFGFVDSALIRPLPYPGLPRLMGGTEHGRAIRSGCLLSEPEDS